MSPLCLPRSLLDPWVDELISRCTAPAMRDILTQLKTRPTFEEQWPAQYIDAIKQGKARLLKLESIRTQPTTLAEILSNRPVIKKWWDSID